MKNKVLILGISSFAGSSFANYLLNNSKFQIFGTFNKKNKLPFKLFLNKNKKFKKIGLYKLDLSLESKNLEKIINKVKPTFIIDFASICMVNESWINPNYYFKVNFVSKINLIKNLDKIKELKKYIYISTPEIFGSSTSKIKENCNNYNPSTPYASSKLATEILLNNYIKKRKFKIVIARFSNFYGRGQPMYRLIPKLVYCINKKIKFPLHGNGNSKRDFIFEDDFNSGILKIINRGKVGSKYHFSGSKFFKISEVIKKVLLVKNYSWKKLIFKTKDRIGKDKNYFLSCEKTKKSLLWKQNISLDEGLKKTIKFYDNIIDEVNDNDARYIL